MPVYAYRCKQDGEFEVVLKMEEATWEYPCPECGLKASRAVGAPPVHYHTDGFYTTDRKGVVGTGDKADALRRKFERTTGRPAPPPATDVPRNGKEIY